MTEPRLDPAACFPPLPADALPGRVSVLDRLADREFCRAHEALTREPTHFAGMGIRVAGGELIEPRDEGRVP